MGKTTINFLSITFLSIVAFCAISCEQRQKVEKSEPGKKAFFEQLLKDPSTGKVPEDEDGLNLNFLRRHLAKFDFVNDEDDYEWIPAGPNNIGGRTDAIAVDSRDANVVLAGGNTGGIWKSTDKGKSWNFKTPTSFSLNVKSIAQHPIEKDTWFYTAGELFKSEDNGETWEMAHSKINENPIEKVIVHHQTGHLYIYAGGSVYRSSDMGANFEEIIVTMSEETYQISSDGKIYVVRRGIKAGTDGGQELKSGIYVSDDNGKTFNEKIVIDDNVLDIDLHRFRVAPGNPNIAWLCSLGRDDADKQSILKFDFSSNSTTDRSGNLPKITTYSGWCFIFEVNPEDPDLLIVGGVGLYLTKDGFSSGVNLYEQYISGMFPTHHPDQQAFAWDPKNPKAAWSCHDGGISYTDDIIKHDWQSKNNKYVTTQFYQVAIPKEKDDNRVVGGTQDNGSPFVKWNDKDYISGNPQLNDGFSCHFGKDYLFTSSQYGGFKASSYNDKNEPIYEGLDDFQVGAPDAENHPFFNYFVVDDKDKALYYIADKQLWRRNDLTTDNGGWDEIATDDIFLSCMALAKNNTLYFGGVASDKATPKLFKLENCHTAKGGATNITPMGVPKEGNIADISIAPHDDDMLLVGTSGHNASRLLFSDDGGKTFVLVTGNLVSKDNLSSDSAFLSTLISHYNGKTSYWVGTTAGLYRTDKLDGQNTQWTIVAPKRFGLARVTDLKTRISDGLVAAATYGRGIVIGKAKKTDGKGPDVVSGKSPIIYPNPTKNGEFTLQLSEDPKNATAQLYSMDGSLVRQVNIDDKSTQVDINTLARGMYIVNINNNGKIWRKKVIR